MPAGTAKEFIQELISRSVLGTSGMDAPVPGEEAIGHPIPGTRGGTGTHLQPWTCCHQGEGQTLIPRRGLPICRHIPTHSPDG